MSYKVDRNRGYQPWAVVNPWVFADYGQPQRLRGQVSPLVYKTQGPYLLSEHLGQAPDAAEARAKRMEIIAFASFGASLVSLYMFWRHVVKPKVQKNKRRRRAR